MMNTMSEDIAFKSKKPLETILNPFNSFSRIRLLRRPNNRISTYQGKNWTFEQYKDFRAIGLLKSEHVLVTKSNMEKNLFVTYVR